MPAPPVPRAAGEERHGARRPAPVDARVSRPLVAGATLVLAGAVLVTVFAAGHRVDTARADDTRRVLDTATALCGIAVFALCRATWRQIGDRAALWAGTAALVVAVAAAARPHLVGALLGDRGPDDDLLTSVSTAATAVAPLLFAAGLVPAVLRFRVRPAGLVAGALGLVATLAAVVSANPGVGPALTVTPLTRGEGVGPVAGGALVVGVWVVLATGYMVRGLRRRGLYTWGGPLLFALTLAGVAAGAAGPDNGWAVGAGVLGALGMVSAVIGCHSELSRTYEDQSLQLFDSALEAETAEVRERVRAADVSARRHDVINALTAIDGAAMILEREFERLSGSDREKLAKVVGSGTNRLRRLIGQESGADASQVSLADTAAEVARDGLQVDVVPDLVGTGSPGETAEAMRQLLEYAHRRAPGRPLTVRGERDGDWVVLRVDDRGPTMPRQLRRTIAGNDRRPVPGEDDAMGLRVAAKLMRAQGGDLWVEPRPGGGTSFGICLPALVVGDRGRRWP